MRKKLIAVVILIGWLGVLGLAALNRQNIQDWWRLRGYQAPTTIANIATQDTMTPYARKVLYVNRPAIENRTSFTQCSQQAEQTIVLGCYHSGQNGIFVLSLTDTRLTGVEQVTTAHEMLHAAYERLSTADRQRIDTLLQHYYDHDLHDQRILDTFESYKKTEPDALVDEMHSIFGTEVASLPVELETYYKRYFTNRAAVTTYAANYQNEFTTRQAAIKRDDAQLASLKQQIEASKADLATQYATVEARRQELDTLRANNDISAYNAGVAPYNNVAADYRAKASQLSTLIRQYNQLVDDRNAVALEAQKLQAEISGQPATIDQ